MVDLVHDGMRMCIMLISVLEGLRVWCRNFVSFDYVFSLSLEGKILVVTPTLTLLTRRTSLIMSE